MVDGEAAKLLAPQGALPPPHRIPRPSRTLVVPVS